ncbi:MAG: hypothetical protein ACOXZ9_00385 [Bacteroidales bacterium]|jgi:flagellar basal body-associated protein FliL
MFRIIIIAILFVAVAVAGIAIKMFFLKDGEFKKSCSSVDPNTGERIGCTCGKGKEGECKNKQKNLISD